MNAIRYCAVAAVMAAFHNCALAQGRPGASNDEARMPVEHRHHGDAAAGAAEAQAPAGDAAVPRAAREWTRLPVIVPAGRGGERERGAQTFALKNSEATLLDVFAPDPAVSEAKRQVPIDKDGAKVSMLPKLGNFYWVSAREEKEGRVSIASTAAYFSEPGPAPTRLLARPINDIEIVPQPLPREHGNYRESEKWRFLLRFKGVPLPNATVKMETEFGTKTSFVSDAEGIVTVLFPRDFKPPRREDAGGGHGSPQRAKFVLAVEQAQDGKQYLAAFNATYSPDADRDRNLAWGVAFGVLGMVTATPLLRRRRADSQGERNA